MKKINFNINYKTFGHLPRKKKKAAKKKQAEELTADEFYIAELLGVDLVQKITNLMAIREIAKEPLREGLTEEEMVKEYISRMEKTTKIMLTNI